MLGQIHTGIHRLIQHSGIQTAVFITFMDDIIISLTWITKIHPLVHDVHHPAHSLILHLYRDPELRQRLGDGAAEKAKLYEEESVHARMKEIYLSV